MTDNIKFFFPIHLDGGNRGCEGIAKGSAIILNKKREDIIGLTNDIVLEKRLGNDKFVTLVQKNLPSNNIAMRILRRIKRMFGLPLNLPDPYVPFIDSMKNSDIMVSTGGDLLCYSNNEVITTNNYASSKGYKTVLWGCSMGPENLTPEKEETLKKFSLIYTRDSLTYNFFKKIGLKNVICYPDPAFILEPEKFNLPYYYINGSPLIGLNLSNFTIGKEKSLDTPFGKEVENFITYILNNTNYQIVLIPHVFWKGQDDRILANLIKNKFKKTNRIQVLDSYNLNYQQIRYAISQCSFFIGARTHAMISAYSSQVPSLALGYSIKSKGIAKDLGLPEELVFNTKNFKEGDLVKRFKYLDENQDSIRVKLNEIIPLYQAKAYEVVNHLNI